VQGRNAPCQRVLRPWQDLLRTEGGRGEDTGWAPATPRAGRSSSPRTTRRSLWHSRVTRPARQQARCGAGKARALPRHPAALTRPARAAGGGGGGRWPGTGNTSSKTQKEQFLPFEEATRVACRLRLVGQKEPQLWCRSGAAPPTARAGGWGGSTGSTTQAQSRPRLAIGLHPSARLRAAQARRARARVSGGGAAVGATSARFFLWLDLFARFYSTLFLYISCSTV